MKILLRVFWLIWIPFLSGLQVRGQELNLVYNGSFEESINCCSWYGSIEAAKGWFQLSGSTDYFNSCCQGNDEMGVPKNKNGHQFPQGGSAYAGFFILADNKIKDDFYYREYLHTKLLQKLKGGSYYKVSFYVSLAESSKIYSDHISICFSADRKLFREKPPYDLLKCTNKISYRLKAEEANDTLNWHKIEMEYQAKGGEEYLVIGSFAGDISKWKYQWLKRKNTINPEGRHSYYYIDNVVVVPINHSKSLPNKLPAKEN